MEPQTIPAKSWTSDFGPLVGDRSMSVEKSIYVEPNRWDVRMSLVNTAFSGTRPVGPDEAES